jgi:hypothetical protein
VTAFNPGDPVFPAELTDADLDRLADYQAGALSTSDETAVARLIDSDPSWGQADAALAAADAAVRLDLGAAGGAIAMPADVSARLTGALAAIDRSTPDHVGTGNAPAARTNVVPIASARSKRRRLAVRLTGVAAAAVIVVGGIAVVAQNLRTPHADRASTTAGAGVANQPAAPNPESLSAPATISSGRDYQPDTLGQLAQAYRLPGAPPALNGSKATSDPAAADSAGGPGPTGPPNGSDLLPCLSAVAVTHPGTVLLIDHALFEGQPAILILIERDGTSTVVVVGPDCGSGGVDELDSAVVG